MRPTLKLNDRLACLDGRIDVDLRMPALDVSRIQASLDRLFAELRTLWSSALEQGDFEEITRLVEASHAVHRAGIALESNTQSSRRADG